MHMCFTHLSCLMTKPTKWHERPAKTQISLGIRPVWSESSLSAWRKLGSLAIYWMHSEDSDQTGRMPSLIWVFVWRTCHFIGFVMRRPVCLVQTHMIYSLFAELRTQPGINNMALMICLLIAQTLYQLGVNRASSVPAWGCQTLGVILHFSWLLVIFWIYVCSIPMFRVFGTTTVSIDSKSSTNQTVLYTAYTSITSALLVFINAIHVVALTRTNGIGYGGDICYISGFRMVGYMFALPVGCAVSFNLLMFLLIVIKIRRTPTVKGDSKALKESGCYFPEGGWGWLGMGNSLYIVWYRRAAEITPIFQVIYTSIGHDFISNIHL